MEAVTLGLAVAGLCAGQDAQFAQESTPRAIRMIALNGDGLLDRLQLGADGSVTIAINQGARQFLEIGQTLPRMTVSDELVEDLNDDGHTDMYLVSPQANAALVGDGTGRSFEGTTELGLHDPGRGVGVHLLDIDGDGVHDVLLHNTDGDVIFWGTALGTFERDPSTPPVEADPTVVGLAVPAPVGLPPPSRKRREM